MNARRGISLIELLIVIAILALLVGLIIPAVLKVRQAAKKTESKNNLRQIVMAVHGYAAAHNDEIPGCKDWKKFGEGPGDKPNLYLLISAHTEVPVDREALGTGNHLTFYVKLFIDPGDPSYTGPVNDINVGNTSYVFNTLAFQGPVRRLGSIFPDGQSNTIGFSTHYMRCGEKSDRTKSAQFKWHLGGGPPIGGTRRATFADEYYGDVLPITDFLSGRISTVPSRRFATFQAAPTLAECDPEILQTPYGSSLVVALMDGSVRDISKQIDPAVFWSAVTPSGGETFTWE